MISDPTLSEVAWSCCSRLSDEHQMNSVLSALSLNLLDHMQPKISSVHEAQAASSPISEVEQRPLACVLCAKIFAQRPRCSISPTKSGVYIMNRIVGELILKAFHMILLK